MFRVVWLWHIFRYIPKFREEAYWWDIHLISSLQDRITCEKQSGTDGWRAPPVEFSCAPWQIDLQYALFTLSRPDCHAVLKQRIKAQTSLATWPLIIYVHIYLCLWQTKVDLTYMLCYKDDIKRARAFATLAVVAIHSVGWQVDWYKLRHPTVCVVRAGNLSVGE